MVIKLNYSKQGTATAGVFLRDFPPTSSMSSGVVGRFQWVACVTPSIGSTNESTPHSGGETDEPTKLETLGDRGGGDRGDRRGGNGPVGRGGESTRQDRQLGRNY